MALLTDKLFALHDVCAFFVVNMPFSSIVANRAQFFSFGNFLSRETVRLLPSSPSHSCFTSLSDIGGAEFVILG